MVTTELGACEWFVWDLRRSNLLDRGQLDQIVGEFLQKNPRAEPPELAEYLIGKKIITQFQAGRRMWNVRIARRKVRSFETCKHAAVVPFVDVGTAGGMHYLAWNFVDG